MRLHWVFIVAFENLDLKARIAFIHKDIRHRILASTLLSALLLDLKGRL